MISVHKELVKKCSELAQVKGVEALRLGYLYDGTRLSEIKIPPLEIFVDNECKKYLIPDISIDSLNKIT